MIKKFWAESILVILTLVGVSTYAVGYSSVISLTPLYLLANMALLYTALRSNHDLLKVWSISAVVGFSAELIGVHTGVLFGDYTYGTILGPTLFNVPLLVGVLWALVSSVLWAVLPKSLGLWRVPVSGTLALLYDLTLEHFATRFGLWTWDGSIPLSNSVGWFVVASVIALIFHYRNYQLRPAVVAKIMLPLHTLFFTVLLLL